MDLIESIKICQLSSYDLFSRSWSANVLDLVKG